MENTKQRGTILRKDILLCTYCSKLCRFSCPVGEASGNETFTPWGKQSILFEIERQNLPSSEEYLFVPFACLECKRCKIFCEYRVDVSECLRMGRIRAFERKKLPPAIIEKHKNIKEREELAKKILERKFPLLKQTIHNKILLMPGCTTALNDLTAIEGAIKLATELAGEDIGLLSSLCCGLPYLQAGDIDNFKISALRMQEVIKKSSLIIVMDPGCAYTMKKLYRQYEINLNPRIVTLVEFISPYTSYFRKKVQIPQPVFYHDPCHLSRDLGITDEPRDILMRIIPSGIKNLFYNREKTLCCGGGGALPETMPEISHAIARKLVELYKKSEAASIVTACPTCKSMISRVAGAPPVFDIAELASKSL